jgi:sRNA-binding regulator protein Hfq
MAYLSGLSEYMDEHYGHSILDTALASGEQYSLFIYGADILHGTIIKNGIYDLDFLLENGEEQTITKTDIKFLCHSSDTEKVKKTVKIDNKTAKQKLSPIIKGKDRHYVKNKTLFPIMAEKQVLIFTTLEGDQLKGLIAGFSRYEITLSLKSGLPVTIFRHAILDLSDKKRRCYLKSTQQTAKDWQKSQLYVCQEI